MKPACTPDSDIQLLEQWREGNTLAGESLFRRYFDPLYRFFNHKCYTETDDLVQATFFACLRGKDQFKGKSTFRTYLYTIARHELYRHLRKAKRLSYKTDFNITSIAEIATTAASKIEKQRSAQMLHRLLSHLPTNQQLLIELYYWHDFDAGSLAEIFEVSRETIRSRIFRIRQLLRSQLSNARPTSPTMRPAQES